MRACSTVRWILPAFALAVICGCQGETNEEKFLREAPAGVTPEDGGPGGMGLGVEAYSGQGYPGMDDTTPAEEPAVETTPADEPPVEVAPADEPPVEVAPADEPPVEVAPADEPAVETTPADEPPAAEPPVEVTPAPDDDTP